jgi:hypothetical protein
MKVDIDLNEFDLDFVIIPLNVKHREIADATKRIRKEYLE